MMCVERLRPVNSLNAISRMNSWIARLKVKAEGSKSNKVPTTRFVKQGSKCRIGEGGGQMMIVRALREQYRKNFY